MLGSVFNRSVLVTSLAVAAVLFSLPATEVEAVVIRQVPVDIQTLAITDIDVFDGQAWHDDTDLIIRDGIIAEIGEDLAIPEGMAVIDGDGRTALPGLIDSHIHTFGAALTDSLRFGVTTNLDMFTAAPLLVGNSEQRESLDQSDISDFFSAGNMATIEGGHGTQFGIPIETLSTPQDASGWVARRLAEGSDYIKMAYIPRQEWAPSLDRETVAAIIQAGHDQGVLVVAHVSTLLAAQEMVDDGIDGLVHLFADVEVSEQFIADAVANEIFIIPTLTVVASVTRTGSSNAFADDSRINDFLTPAQTASMSSSFPVQLPGYNFDIAKHNVRRLHAAGVPLLAGSDAPNPGTSHGASLLHEIELLVEAGLTNTEALQAASYNPAQAFGLDGRGSILVGARADLVILAADPRDDIRDIRGIDMIIKNGFVVDRPEFEVVVNPPIETSELGDFELSLNTDDGFIWSATDDSMMGGGSTASIEHITPGADGSAGAVTVRASVRPGFFAPWAGLSLGMPAPQDLNAYSQISFQVRGTPGSYSAMMFNSVMTGTPPTQRFEINENWRTIVLDLDAFSGFDNEDFVALALVAGTQSGDFSFEVDSVRLQ